MFGKEDEDILNYFIKTSFPTEQESVTVMEYIANHDGVRLYQMYSALNIRKVRIDKALSFLMHDGFVIREKQLYYATPKTFMYDRNHYDAVTATRIQEMEQMKELAHTKSCYSRFVVECLDDHTAHNCGHCSNCLGREILSSVPSIKGIHIAEEYVNDLVLEIEPRKKWVLSDCTENRKIQTPNQVGLCLARYGDPGYGELVKRDKYNGKNRFCDELVGRSTEVLRPFIKKHSIQYVTCVPSLRSEIVSDFSKRLADSLGILFVNLLKKKCRTAPTNAQMLCNPIA